MSLGTSVSDCRDDYEVGHDGHMWWWCLMHARVESELGCAHQMRLGPFATAEGAAQALQKAAERNRAWSDEEADDD